jgi:uncharacterized protein (TIGR03000 family)
MNAALTSLKAAAHSEDDLVEGPRCAAILVYFGTKEKIMRRTVLILGLVAATWVMAASDVFAQRVWVGGRRGAVSVGVGSGYYGGGGYYGRGYYGGGYGRGYYGRGYGGYYPGYYGNYYGNAYAPGVSYSSPIYSVNPIVQVPTPDYRQSFYTDPNSATLTVLVPNPATQVWFDGTSTTQRGMERIFHTPSLQQAGTYTIKARWTNNGQTVDRERIVQVQPGQAVVVDFRASW